jgi:hypothetical protein
MLTRHWYNWGIYIAVAQHFARLLLSVPAESMGVFLQRMHSTHMVNRVRVLSRMPWNLMGMDGFLMQNVEGTLHHH